MLPTPPPLLTHVCLSHSRGRLAIMVFNRGSRDEPSVTFDLSELGFSCADFKATDLWNGEVSTTPAGLVTVQQKIPTHGSTVILVEGNSSCELKGGEDQRESRAYMVSKYLTIRCRFLVAASIDSNKLRIPSSLAAFVFIFVLAQTLNFARGRPKHKED